MRRESKGGIERGVRGVVVVVTGGVVGVGVVVVLRVGVGVGVGEGMGGGRGGRVMRSLMIVEIV